MYKVYFVNHLYYSSEKFDNVKDALNYAKGTGFECRIDKDNEPVCSWSPIMGLRYYS